MKKKNKLVEGWNSGIKPELVIKAYREMSQQLIRAFVPADNQDFSMKFLDTIESNPEKALQDLRDPSQSSMAGESEMEEGMAKMDPHRALDMKQGAWKAGQQKTPEELAKEKEIQKRKALAKDTYSHIGGKPDWMVEVVKEAFEKVAKKRKSACGLEEKKEKKIY